MLNFEFHNPTRIVFGQGKVADLARLVPPQARVLVLYGGASARKTGTLDEVMAALAGRTVTEFGGIEPNPTYETLMRATAPSSWPPPLASTASPGTSCCSAAATCSAPCPWAPCSRCPRPARR